MKEVKYFKDLKELLKPILDDMTHAKTNDEKESRYFCESVGTRALDSVYNNCSHYKYMSSYKNLYSYNKNVVDLATFKVISHSSMYYTSETLSDYYNRNTGEFIELPYKIRIVETYANTYYYLTPDVVIWLIQENNINVSMKLLNKILDNALKINKIYYII